MQNDAAPSAIRQATEEMRKQQEVFETMRKKTEATIAASETVIRKCQVLNRIQEILAVMTDESIERHCRKWGAAPSEASSSDDEQVSESTRLPVVKLEKKVTKRRQVAAAESQDHEEESDKKKAKTSPAVKKEGNSHGQ